MKPIQLTLIALLLCVAALVFGQKSYYKINQATVYDIKIRVEPGIQPYYSCKIINKSGMREYTPEEITEYKPKYGSVYVSFDMGDEGMVFLERIVEGPVNLYHLVDKNFKKRYFLQRRDEGVIELLDVKRRSRNYKTIIESYWTECDQFTEIIDKTDFNLQALKRSIETHNYCEEPYNPETQKRLTIGIGYTNVSQNAAPGVDAAIPTGVLGLFDYKRKASFKLGYILDFPIQSSDASFTTGIRFHYADLNYFEIQGFGEVDYSIDNRIIDIGIPLGLSYTHAAEKLRPFITFQVVPSYIIVEDVSLVKTIYNSDGSRTIETSDFGASKFGIGARGGIGLFYDLSDQLTTNIEVGIAPRYSLGSDRVFNISSPFVELGFSYSKAPKKRRSRRSSRSSRSRRSSRR